VTINVFICDFVNIIRFTGFIYVILNKFKQGSMATEIRCVAIFSKYLFRKFPSLFSNARI